MENASKALIIAGAILLSILIIAIGIYIFQSASGTIENSMASMNTQEIEAWNSQFTSYAGENQSGTKVRALIQKLISNANTYMDEPGKVPKVNSRSLENAKGETITDLDGNGIEYKKVDEDAMNEYISALNKIYNSIVNKHKYVIEFTYGASGLITEINIADNTVKGSYYDPNTNYADQNYVNDLNNDKEFDGESDFVFN